MQNAESFSSSSELLLEENEEPPGSSGCQPMPGLASIPFILTRPRAVVTPIPPVQRTPRTLPRTRAFRRRFYRDVCDRQWNDWHWQIANRIRTSAQAGLMLRLSPEERNALDHNGVQLPFSVTPYYMSLLSADDPMDPLRRTVIPTVNELLTFPGEADDPLGEEGQSPVPGVVHRYPDRVLLLLIDFCSTYCRYCTRSRVVGHGAVHLTHGTDSSEPSIYIRRTPSVRDVLLSGGDPLTLGDEKLEWVVRRLREIPHVEIIRIGTKIPAVLPQRVTPPARAHCCARCTPCT